MTDCRSSKTNLDRDDSADHTTELESRRRRLINNIAFLVVQRHRQKQFSEPDDERDSTSSTSGSDTEYGLAQD